MRKRGTKSLASTELPEWKEIDELAGYRFCIDGTVWSCWVQRPLGYKRGNIKTLGDRWFQLKNGLSSNGKYYQVFLRGRCYNVHCLILTAFVGPRPKTYQCRHLDGNGLNNRLENLAWGTGSENHKDKRLHGTANDGERNHFAVLTSDQVSKIRSMPEIGKVNLAKMFGTTRSNIDHILARRTWVNT